jgi:hypothetical protein
LRTSNAAPAFDGPRKTTKTRIAGNRRSEPIPIRHTTLAAIHQAKVNIACGVSYAPYPNSPKDARWIALNSGIFWARDAHWRSIRREIAGI